jgi:enoyl-CoA hydratase/carnithine racemase
MEHEELLVQRQGRLLTVTFNRPDQRNAMTWGMYDGLVAACDTADQDDDIRVMVLRGAGDDAFVAGTDIAQFQGFDGQAGVAYEARIAAIVDRLERVTVPTVAAVRGFCVGGGLALAAACDLRVATPAARFGVPIARTLGNCLSMNTYSLLVHHLGPARTLDMLLRARMVSGEQAHAAGFVTELTDDERFEQVLDTMVTTLSGHAPLTMWATKEAVRRLRVASLPDGDDLVATVFGSRDFRHGVEAFLQKEKAQWEGR